RYRSCRVTLVVRTASVEELDAIYAMGVDAWSERESLEAYLAGCRASAKYQRGRWFVLANGAELLSSLIMYSLGESMAGIGSVATPPALRRRGHASALIRGVVTQLEQGGIDTVFLFSDVAPGIYRRLGFEPLPAPLQRKAGSVCMLRSPRFDAIVR